MIKQKIGNRIQACREEAKISQEQLAEIVELTPLAISFIETGRNAPSINTFVKIANALKVSTDVLLADVLDYGYKIKASQFGEMMEQVDPGRREQVFDVVSAMLKR